MSRSDPSGYLVEIWMPKGADVVACGDVPIAVNASFHGYRPRVLAIRDGGAAWIVADDGGADDLSGETMPFTMPPK